MAWMQSRGKRAGVLLFAGALAGCSGSRAGLLEVLAVGPDASGRPDAPGQRADAVAPAPPAHADGSGVEAPSSQAATALASETGPVVVDAAPVVVDASAAADDGGALEEAAPDSADSQETSRASCRVTFTVAAAWVDGVIYQQVAVGGDVAALGAWNPQAAVAMTQVASGTWTVGVMLADGEAVQFRFVKHGPGVDSWEDWAPNSNRSLSVACGAASGDVEAGAGAGPVVGVSYAGNFNVQPPDAT